MNNSVRRLIPFFLSVVLFAPMPLTAEDDVRVSGLLELWKDATVFSPRFFPETESLSIEDIFVAGLEAQFPHRVSREEPGISPGPEEPPLIESLLPGVTYVRVRHLEAALPAIREAIAGNSLVLDLRFVEAEHEPVLELGAVLAINETVKISLNEKRAGGGTSDDEEILIQTAGLRRPLQPVFVLTNQATAGPIEALLAELKNKGQIISIGTRTAGRTGRFHHVDTIPSLYVLSGEWQPASGESLLNDGFTPSVLMSVAVEEDRNAYQALTNGVPLRSLVAADPADNDQVTSADLRELLANDVPEAPADTTVDPILQRAYFIVTALRSMGKIADPSES